MIDDKKLLCAFIYSAYASGYCGLTLDSKKREEHMGLYIDYLKNSKYFPKKEIDNTQLKMTELIDDTDIRNYIYHGHYEFVKNRIKEQSKVSFEKALDTDIFRATAFNCPINFYKVLSIDHSGIVGENIVTKKEKTLICLEGLENPKENDIVSGHWNYFLEIIPPDKLETHLRTAKGYFDKIKR